MSAVSPGARRSPVLLPILCLLLSFVLALGGCGGGGEDEAGQDGSTSAPATEPAGGEGTGAQGQAGQRGEADEQAEGQERESAEGLGSPNPPIAKERTPGSKAVAPGVPTVKSGDNSVQAFGTEGEEEEAEQAAEALKRYLDARASGDWQGACEAASTQLREELAKLIERAKAKGDTEKPQGCAETLELLFGKSPSQALKEAAQIDRVLSFRVQADGYAYLIYEAGAAVKFIAMANDDGTWKPNTLEPEAFQGPQGEVQ